MMFFVFAILNFFTRLLQFLFYIIEFLQSVYMNELNFRKTFVAVTLCNVTLRNNCRFYTELLSFFQLAFSFH